MTSTNSAADQLAAALVEAITDQLDDQLADQLDIIAAALRRSPGSPVMLAAAAAHRDRRGRPGDRGDSPEPEARSPHR